MEWSYPRAMSDAERLSGLVAVWWRAINDFTSLLESVPHQQWSTPTDLPGWDVHAVAAHIAHLENLLAGGQHEEVDIGDAPHVSGTMGTFTEQGVQMRRDASPDDLINEIRSSATARHTELLADPPTDGSAPAPGIFGAIGWSTSTLLRNRPLDVWMHEQDVRRAVERPGGLDSEAAVHSADYLLESLPFVVAKRAKCPPGTTVLVEVTDHGPVTVEVGEDGRGAIAGSPADPDVRLCTDRESFLMLAGGRRTPPPERVVLEGDADLGRRIVAAMAVTP